MNEIEQFIHDFKRYDTAGEVTKTFMEGYCFHFALILKSIFGGDIVYDVHRSHFLLIDNKGAFYDITGKTDKVDDPYQFPDGLMQYDERLCARIIRDCVYKRS